MIICSPHVSIAPESSSGGEVYEREVLKHLALRGVRIDLILPGRAPCWTDIPNWHVHRTRLPKGFRWYVSNLVFPPYIKRVYDNHPFDLLRAHSVRFTGPACLWARRHYQLPVPVVVHHHHLDPDPLNRVVERHVFAAADSIVTVSEFSRRQLVAFGVDGSKIAVVYNGVDTRFAPHPKDEELLAKWELTGKKVLLYLGALTPRKNLGLLLEVFARVAAQHGDKVRLILAGSGPEEAQLQKQAQILNITGQVVFAGYVPEADKVRYYNLADVFVQTSKLEGFGLVVAEAMACGIPVVVSRMGSLPEVVADGTTGYLCSLGDTEAFATAIGRLLDDVGLRQQMGQAAQARVRQRFNWDRAAHSVGALYQEMIRNRRL